MTEPTKKNKSATIRFALDFHTSEILKGWRQQITGAFPQMKVTDTAIIRWAIARTATLSKADLKSIKATLFDEVKELEKIVKSIKEAKAGGDKQSVVAALRLCTTLFRAESMGKAVPSPSPFEKPSE